MLEDGGRVMQESRLWNNAEGRTYSMRSKEQAHDYRYFPEPDLPPLVVGAEWQKQILAAMPELPEARRARLVADYGLSAQDAATLTTDRALGDFFEQAARAAKSPKRVAAILLSEITMRLRAAGIELGQSPVRSTASSSPPTSPKPAKSPASSSSSSSTPASPKAATSPSSTTATSRSRSPTPPPSRP